ncbi:MAG TPA: LiaF domain-containing protein [Gemmatimonadaceae bacterium]|nr:LiaF domain-containing protein [Gemmatimonadaceae bacterium]
MSDGSPTPPVPNFARAREQKIEELSSHFANDDLSLDDLERRIERVYKATNLVELDAITADLRAMVPAAGSAVARRSDAAALPAALPDAATNETRLLAIMGETRRMGRWAVPRRTRVLAVMSDTKLDLTQAVLPAGVVDLHVSAVMSNVKITVPEGMRVINEMHAIMASVNSNADELPRPGDREGLLPVVRLTGTAFMAEVRVRVRRREYLSEDDDD